MNVQIRSAQRDDCETIVEFNFRLAAESEGKQLDRTVVRRGVEAVLADPTKGRYFVASVGGEVVGQIMHTREWSDWRNGDLWWLQSVYVAPEFRRQGVFRQLFEHVLHTAEADPNVVGIRLYVEEQNTAAHETYARMGLAAPGYFVMERIFSEK